uniref:Ig-like domain-containing protein n=1 Tax=Apteryx owenii TaxID=8824 RepID=A0A8B9P3W3_APTOW
MPYGGRDETGRPFLPSSSQATLHPLPISLYRCKVSGSLPVTAKWFKDGKEITDSAKCRSLCHENTMSLEIANLELADTANYTCSVSNVAGSDSCSAVLTVKDSTVEFKTTLKGTPPFTVKWFKEDLELVSGPTCFIGIEITGVHSFSLCCCIFVHFFSFLFAESIHLSDL